MDKEFVRELIRLLRGSNVKCLSLETEGFKLYVETYHKDHQAVETPQREPLQEAEAKELPKELHVIKSPLVGTFYRSPAPGAPPFVEVGDIVSPGQVLCIVEALKVMNEIESDVRGKVVQIMVNNGETVEYGQPLFLIDTSV
ncbi:MAG: acetyl-CoA carboxylase biotin carboxyl carrier protein [Aquificaceae bacterium]|nr:acetyl-CoA carboxylase biotin carboxyl carrier protein [Aquificaceae bacterium]MCX8060484.1 acetyl-CoA carboxylase biotin carboxyl carrier protein [Aquificaceae bacterium]MDW8097670.1 acetyl-CoA carboxylase biotin carboxyl carrier protein [Aquificaceae bacterium]